MEYEMKKEVIKKVKINIEAGDVIEWTDGVGIIRAVVTTVTPDKVTGLCYYDSRPENYKTPHISYFYPREFLDRIRKLAPKEWEAY